MPRRGRKQRCLQTWETEGFADTMSEIAKAKEISMAELIRQALVHELLPTVPKGKR